MEIVKSIDSFLDDVWKVVDGLKTVAICYNENDAKICKTALELEKARKEREENAFW